MDDFPWHLMVPYEALPGELDPLVFEVWRPVRDFRGYEVSSFGGMRSWRKAMGRAGGWSFRDTPRPMKAPPNRDGYPTVGLSGAEPSSGKTCKVHTLVLESFVGPRPDGLLACHSDGNPGNNRLDNLRWDSRHENAMDDLRNGGNGRYKITPDDVRGIWRMALEGKTSSEIGRVYPVEPANVPHILSGRSWSSVTKDLPGFPLIRPDNREPVFVPDCIANSPVELWAIIPDFPGYRVSIWGRVQSSSFQAKGIGSGRGMRSAGGEWRDLKPIDIGDHYARFHLKRPGKTRFVPVHILILECFACPRPPGMHACHIDGDRRHNRAANLRWDTVRANRLDREMHRKLRESASRRDRRRERPRDQQDWTT